MVVIRLPPYIANVDMKKLSENIGLIERFLQIAEKYKFSTICKALAIIFIFAITIFLISNPTYFFDKYEEIKENRHKEQMEVVMRNNVIIQTELENLLFKTGANRCILLQYHNTKNSLSGLPFIYLTATNESLTYNTTPVSEGYETLKTSLYPFVGYLAQYRYFCGNIEDLEKFDKALAFRMKGNDVQHLAMCHIDSEVPLGVLVLTYTHNVEPNKHNCCEVEQLVRNTALKIGVLIDGKK